VGDDTLDRLGRIGLVEVAIEVVQELDLANAQHLRGGKQFGRAELTQRDRPWIIAWICLPAALAARRGNEIGFDARRRVLRQRAARAQCLVIGVGEDA
jgi:hypothetical protein